MYRYVVTSKAGKYDVYVNMIESAGGRFLSRHPYVIKLVKEVLLAINLKDDIVTIEQDMGRVIGSTDIIETTEKDIIFYAQPSKKETYSRYAKNRYPSPSQKLTMILNKDKAGDYEITETWIGPNSPPFPGDVRANAKSKIYWESHALAQDAETVQTKTITRVCPY